MKRIIISAISLVFAASIAFADNVSEKRAHSYADAFLQSVAPKTALSYSSGSGAAKGSSLHLVFSTMQPATKASAAAKVPSFYAFNRDGGGYVIISGLDNVHPVVGYSADGYLDPNNMSPELAWWLRGVEQTIADVRAKGTQPDAETVSAWSDATVLASTKAGSEYTCLTPEWKQGDPFNCKCPIVGGGRSITGCVPLAISEVMCYYGHPAKGTGTLPEYVYGGSYHAGGYELTTYYDWANLRNVTSDNTSDQTAAVIENLGQLIADVGQAMQVSYGTSATSGNSSLIVSRICTYFGYRKDATIKPRALYSTTDWYTLIRNEIVAGRPVLYSGNEPEEGGHTFIIDGVNTSYLDYVHINFGWGGYQNGWLNLGLNFYGDQEAVFGFKPDDGTGPSDFASGNIKPLGGNIFQLPSEPVQGEKFETTIKWLNCYGSSGFSGLLKIVHLTKDGTFVENVTSNRTVSMDLSGLRAITISDCKINEPIAFGDKLALAYKKDGESTWYYVRSNVQGESNSYYPLTGHPKIVAESSYDLNTIFYLRLDNIKYSYMFSTYASKPTYESYGRTCKWKVYVDGVLYKDLRTYDVRYFTLNKVGTWTIRCDMYSAQTGELVETLMTKFTVN